MLRLAAEDFARGSAPEEITKVFMMASMTALRKSDGGVRGIATGNVLQAARTWNRAAEIPDGNGLRWGPEVWSSEG